ncbi:hypothetical protein DFP93_105218 [Aneurinibacillus soli]|uniref:Uncharacterized protein n=1 Tax=Aneurinibacillus soli TaxID=1500254 RepID=A0A0U5BAB4_9BACL|nr:hypothetical protein [Aneurinibacillus soli]PYE62261.1 hypothetical protein DFP93_105218 [Aneurinibacillus soli]BAU28550.1 hypothetical protein CB4_02725 [Aneurinibacillus soli]
MKRKWFLFTVLIVLVSLVGIFLFMKKTHPLVQRTVVSKYSEGDSLIHAYPNDAQSQVLSESVGLYMKYLLMEHDADAFDQQAQHLKERFIVKRGQNTFIQWVLGPDTSANALIDDVRIIHALNEGAKQFHKKEYQELATIVASSIERSQKKDGFYVDYVEWHYNQTASRITLSYLTPEFFKSLSQAQKNQKLLKNVSSQSVFFPEYYDLEDKQFKSAPDVHMIDQVLIAMNRESFGISSPTFEKWIISEWTSHKKIMGQYDRKSLKPSVSYESLSVYAYIATYFHLIGQESLAKEVEQRADVMARSGVLNQAHFFDYILFETMKKSLPDSGRLFV